MINLLRYYFKNIKPNEYYYKFYNEIIGAREIELMEIEDKYDIKDGYLLEYDFIDDEDIIREFKLLCEPNLENHLDNKKKIFYLVCFYLFSEGYKITQFPRLLQKPPDHPYDFTNTQIRNELRALGKQRMSGVIPYEERRKFINSLNFEKKSNIKIEEDIDKLFAKISTRNASFESMTNDERLKEIANLIEYMLAEKGKFKELEYNTIAFEYIDNETIKKFRNQIQCFRHASQNSIEEREKFTDNQKDFLIDYGVTIIKMIFKLTRKD